MNAPLSPESPKSDIAALVATQVAILDALPAHVALLDARGIITAVNEAWRRFADANSPPPHLRNVGTDYLAVCDRAGDDAAHGARRAAAGIRAVLSGETRRFVLDYSCDAPDEQRWFQMAVTPLGDEHPNGAVVMHTNVTPEMHSVTLRKDAELKIRRLNRVYAMLSGISSLIVRVSERDELYRATCRIAVEVGAFKMAWIGVIDPQTLEGKVVARFGGEDAYVEKLTLTALVDTPDSELLASRALRQMRPVICNDIATDPAVQRYRGDLLARGYKSTGCFPLILAGRPHAVFALYAGEADIFDAEEAQLLLECSGDIAFAVDHLDKAEQLHYVAYYDPLTGLANRRLFLERVTLYMGTAATAGHKLGLCLFDVERFKNINDTYGRPVGDVLLQQVAKWLTEAWGDAILLARVGADVFAVVLPDIVQEDEIARPLERIVEQFTEHTFHAQAHVFRIAVRVGVALFPDDGANADIVFAHAEAALKKAKVSGDRYLFYAQKMTETIAGRVALEFQLRHALENNDFVLYYQPKINLATGKITGAEALMRWLDPRKGLVPPDRFIPMLEETGLILAVGRWALQSAIADYLKWRAAGLDVGRVAVNVSALQLRNRDFIAEIEEALGIDEHAAAGLEVEITESVVMEDIHRSNTSLQAIRAMGIKIAMDDFGTGFSSLSYLAKLPVDTLKIDRSFIVEMMDGAQGLTLVTSIVNLAHSLKLNVVAEGVETAEQSRLLRLLGCDEMQGWLFSKALPIGEFEALLRSAAHSG